MQGLSRAADTVPYNLQPSLQHPSKTVHTVQDAAASWGFWHLEQFSADYKHLFGELPSNTLQAALVK